MDESGITTWLPGVPLPKRKRLERNKLYHVQTELGAFTVIDRGDWHSWRGLPPLDVCGTGNLNDFRRVAGLA